MDVSANVAQHSALFAHAMDAHAMDATSRAALEEVVGVELGHLPDLGLFAIRPMSCAMADGRDVIGLVLVKLK
jgi:hypothetical protein